MVSGGQDRTGGPDREHSSIETEPFSGRECSRQPDKALTWLDSEGREGHVRPPLL